MQVFHVFPNLIVNANWITASDMTRIKHHQQTLEISRVSLLEELHC